MHQYHTVPHRGWVEEAQAASPFGWERWTLDVDILGVDRFGASGPGPEVLAEHGFTVDNVVARTVAVLKAQTARTSART